MTAHTPTPEEFLALPSEPDEDLDELDPIADLERRVAALEERVRVEYAGEPLAEWEREYLDAQSELEVPELPTPDEAYAALAAEHDAATALIEEIRTIIKPSTSKLANAVRAAIEAWAVPQTPSPAHTEPAVDEAAAGVAPAQDVQPSAGEGLQVPVENATEMGLPVPVADAPVEEWRSYARFLGHGRTGPAFNELEAMNRSQIRTMLGIEQPVEAVSP